MKNKLLDEARVIIAAIFLCPPNKRLERACSKWLRATAEYDPNTWIKKGKSK